MTQWQRAENLQKRMPTLREADKKAMNRLFTAYIFRSGHEIWTSCCCRHKVLDEKACSGAEWNILHERHVPEPRYHFYRCTNEFESGRRVTCPYCGAEAKLKETQYAGKRKNLWEYRRAVVLRQWRGSLWAMAYDLSKNYQGSRNYRPNLNASLLGVYRFREGYCEKTEKSWWESGAPYKYGEMKCFDWKQLRVFSAPYGCCSEFGKRYEVIGWEELRKSDFRYCGIEKTEFTDPLKLLTLCCFAARKIEMLNKAGMGWAVRNLLEERVKNARILNWAAETPKKFLRVPLRELREIGMQEDRLRLWQRLGKPKVCQLDAAEEIECFTYSKEIFTRCRALGISYRELLLYLNRERKDEKQRLNDVATIWKDYIDAAEKVGLDLTNRLVQMPKELNTKHDRACDAWAAMQDAEKLAAYQHRFQKLKGKYAFAFGGLQVVVPRDGEDIKNEGKALHHCVGGYADRHLNGNTTILFLRRQEETPMATIEIYGSTIRQIHGYDDERTACAENPDRISCHVLYAEFLQKWLAWVKAGSRRDKRGLPILPKSRKKSA